MPQGAPILAHTSARPLPFFGKGRAVVGMAPMAEITDAAFRTVCFECGADFCVTEMVSAAGLYHRSPGSPPLLERLEGECDKPVIAQIYGREVREIDYAVRYITENCRFCAIDLNAGCPAPTVVKCGAGSALMEDPRLIGRLLSCMVSATHLPITLKTRIGPNPERPMASELAHIAEDSGASMLAMHGRWTSRCHSGPVEMDRLAEAVAAVKIPVLVNGGIQSGEDAQALIEKTGAAGVLLGRGAVGNPWLFARAIRRLGGSNSEPTAPDGAAIIRMALHHMELLLEIRQRQHERHAEAYPSDPRLSVVNEYRRYILTYFKGKSGAAALRRSSQTLKSYDDIVVALWKLLEEASEGGR